MQAFPYPHMAYEFRLDHLSFEHLIETLLEASCFDDKDMEYFGRWFQWCLSVEQDLLPELEAFLKSERALAFDGNGFVTIRELLEKIESRRRHESLDAAACHAGVAQALADIGSADGFPHDAVGEIELLLDQLVRIEAPEPLAEFATSWLALNPIPNSEVEDADDSEQRDEYRFGLGVYLAGELGLVSGIDRIIDGVSRADWDWLNEGSLEALSKMPPAEATAGLRARWWQLPEYGRLFFSDVFEIAHLPEHRDFYLENMRRADDFDFEIIPHRMARALGQRGGGHAIHMLQRQIQKRYRELFKTHHPDRQDGAHSPEMAAINEAYALLMDYCRNYKISFDENQIKEEPRDWWKEQFGDSL